MDMILASNSDLDAYPHVFLTADTPWNPDIVDDEFYFDAHDSLVDSHDVQSQCEACNPQVDPYGEFNALTILSFDPLVTQAHHAGALDSLVLLPQKIGHHLPDLDALLPNFG